MSTFKILKKAEVTQAALKLNIYGSSGTGKTTAAMMIARGLAQHTNSQKPVAVFDTEQGSDFWTPRFERYGVGLLQAKTRAFSDLMQGLREAATECDVVVIDSVTHFWRELIDSYLDSQALNKLLYEGKIKSVDVALENAQSDIDYADWLDRMMKKVRSKTPAFHEWAYLKGEWARFTDFFVNSNLHIINCGRGGWEYDFFKNDQDKMELRKTGSKMKAEGEFGYESSLLLECTTDRKSGDAASDGNRQVLHKITVLKDRFRTILVDEYQDTNHAQYAFVNLLAAKHRQFKKGQPHAYDP